MSKTLLLVDDETPIQRVLAPVLRADGWRVLEAVSAQQALACAARDAIDIVLLDLGLPDADGKDIIAGLRSGAISSAVLRSAEAEPSREST